MLKYVDKDGGKHFVDDYEKVPPEYRSQLKGQIIIEEEPARKKSRPPEWQPSPDAQTAVAAPAESGAASPAAQPEANPMPSAPLERTGEKKGNGFLNKLADFTENSTIGFIVKILSAITMLIVFLGIVARIRSNLKGKKLGVLILISITLGVLFYLANSHLRKIDASFKALKNQVGEIEKKLAGRNAQSDKIMKEMQVEGQGLQENIAAHHAAQQELTRQNASPQQP